MCIEDHKRDQYARYLEERIRTQAGSRDLADDVETSIQSWTYETVLDAVEKGGRICKVADGEGERVVFQIKYFEGFKVLGQRRDAMNGV